MNRQFTFYRRATTTLPPEAVFAAVEQSLKMTVRGSVSRNANTFLIDNGTLNLNFAFVANVNAQIALTQPAPDTIDMHGTVTLSPNTFFWLMGILGFFCLYFLWGFNIFYIMMDPRVNYQLALDRVDLTGNTAGTSPVQPFGV